MRAALALGSLLVVELLSAQQAPPDSITLCRVDLKLGMDKDPVITAVAESCTLTLTANVWYLHAKRAGAPDGVIEFADGKLSHITKHWLPDNDLASVVSTYYAAVTGILSDGRSPRCEVATQKLDVGNSSPRPDVGPRAMREVAIKCGAKQISISILRVDGRDAVNIDETLRGLLNPPTERKD